MDTLGRIEELGVSTPRYERAALTPRILHLGVGGFHRAHLALYVHELAAQGGDWGIRGLGRLESDRRMASVLESQDCLYTLIERDSRGSRPKIVGSIVDYVLAVGRRGCVRAPDRRSRGRHPVDDDHGGGLLARSAEPDDRGDRERPRRAPGQRRQVR